MVSQLATECQSSLKQMAPLVGSPLLPSEPTTELPRLNGAGDKNLDKVINSVQVTSKDMNFFRSNSLGSTFTPQRLLYLSAHDEHAKSPTFRSK
ncbi:hypothetical protein M514_12879 [Trichuris suis]|uniref:Uncharacterized protein n=1 Tax=Trichuris suis TaxID=68888 RepID=A0A085LMP0_9BILA|nr:hypothetical protein M513_12879 [Trichuris suis]KFD60401.1 hypothetical protein M514_12879 [Trichuris suis]